MAEAQTTEPIGERQRLLNRSADLKSERDSWIAHWQEINDYVLPRRLRYLAGERNNGRKRNDKIINGRATKAARTLGAGKMAGQSSPARPWFRYVVPRAVIGDALALEWTAIFEAEVYACMGRSNFYSKLHETWFLQGTFATAVIYIEEDDEDDIRCHVWPLGQYCLASSGRGRIDTVYREFAMTVEQTVKSFGLKKCSPRVQDLYRLHQLDKWVEILHVIEPNYDRDPSKYDADGMPFRSLWMERDASADWDQFLRKSGYEEQPFFVARWDVIGEDIYGSGCPAMDALGDIKALQKLEIRKAEAVDKVVRPPMKAPASAKTQRLSALPGDISYLDETAQGAKFESVMEVRPESISAAEESCREHEQRIDDAFYVSLFLMMAMDNRQQPATAREINEKHEEKMLMLGPVVTRDNDDVLDPAHNRISRILARRGRIPPVPESMADAKVKIEYISIMSQAQKLLGTASTERYVSFIGSLSAARPEVLDIPNFDKICRNYADVLGLKPDEINPQDVVEAVRAARAQAQQAQQAMQAAQATAETAKAASQAELGGDSMLTRLMQGVGAQPPQPYGGN